MRKTKILICSSEVGAGKRGASLGPDAVRLSAVNLLFNIFERLPTEEIKIKKINKFSPENKSAKYIKMIIQVQRKIARKMAEAQKEGYTTLIFSGDHSNGAGFISGMREAYPDKKIGVIWIDAHGDLHSPYTSPSGNMHGMPVAIILCIDNKENQTRRPKPEVIKNWDRLKQTGLLHISPKIHPEDIVFIGIRDLEAQEWAVIKSNNIKYFSPKEIEKQGIAKVIKKTEEHFADYDVLYVSFDVDSLDPSISKGTGTPVPDGLSMDDAKKLLKAFYAMPNFKALEVTEVNPLLDSENKMATAVVKILREAISFY